MYTQIQQVIETLDISSISQERKSVLQPLIDYVQEKVSTSKKIRLNFICTHNSRRSHLGQVWAQTIATYYTIDIDSYSGGTEATALFIAAKNTLENVGFQIQKISETNNPVYAIKYAENAPPIIGFSKTFDNAFNPSSGFGAVLTCSQADEGCPFIAGAEKRIPVTYEDPKAFDDSPDQEKMYSERSMQIATEMKYVFSNVQ